MEIRDRPYFFEAKFCHSLLDSIPPPLFPQMSVNHFILSGILPLFP